MLPQLEIPRIILNDDAISIKSERTNSTVDTHPVLTSCRNSSESLFKYDVSSSNTSMDGLDTNVEDNQIKELNVDDPFCSIPYCFVYSPVISEKDFRNFARRKRIDRNASRFEEVFHYVDTRTMIPMVGNVIKSEIFDSWPPNPAQKEKKVLEFIEDIKTKVCLRHRRIVHLYGAYRAREKIIVFNEYVPRGSVFDRVKKGPLEENTAIKYFRQAIEGLRYIHSHKITHGNIRASNLLITFSDDIKITDFALSYKSENDNFGGTSGGISNYRMKLLHAAPESIQMMSEKPGVSVDIWALGCVLVTMLTQTPPYYKAFHDKTDQEIYKIITDNYSKPAEERLSYSSGSLIPQASEDVRRLLDFVMNDDQFVRPTAEEILGNQVLKKNASECHQISLFSFRKNSEKPVNNGHLVDNKQKYEMETEPLIRNYTNISHDKNDITVTELPSNQGLRKSKNAISLCCGFFGSRIFIFLLLMLKWALMVFAAAFALAGVSSMIFLSIVIIYRLIKVSCQCELNEGFVVLIAIIFLPIIILLTTLCCNNACEKYHTAIESEKLKESRFYIGEPASDVILCGVRVIHGQDRKKVLRAKKTTEGTDGELGNQSPSGMLKTIEHLA